MLLPLLVVACGGGGGGGGGPPVIRPVVLTGFFTDSAVGGLSFSTATQSGVTTAAGAYTYLAGETITFSIGGTVIGEPATATGAMTPADLVPGLRLYTTVSEVKNAFDKPGSAESRAANRFINIIVFLQTLDEDANPDNGITIPAGIATLLNGIQIDFDLDFFDDFFHSHDVRSTTYQAQSLGLLSTGAIRKAGAALDHFYAFQGISHSFGRIATFGVDFNGDENIDEFYTPTYDANGNLIRVSGEFTGDATPDYFETYTYDANGNLIRYTEDFAPIGSLDLIETRTYDVNGSVIKVTRDNDGDGTLDRVTIITRDPTNGNRILLTRDDGDNGTINRRVTWTYDVNGNQASQIVDLRGDGTSIFTITIEPVDTEIRRTRDDGPDGILDLIETLTYDADGNLLTFTQDFFPTGSIDFTSTSTYNSDGNVILFTEDFIPNGSIDFTSTSTYDANGNQVSFIVTDAVGTQLFIETRTHDANGNEISSTQDVLPLGSVDFTDTATYDANGNLIRYTADFVPFGILDYIETLTYETGNWTSLLSEILDDE